MKKELVKLLSISLLFIGCGSGESTSNNTSATANSATNTNSTATTQTANTPSNTSTTPAYKAINNRGIGVEGKMGNYTVKLFANNNETAKPQERHQGVVVKYNGETSETMAIQDTYKGKEIIAGIYNEDKLVKMSDSVSVTDVPVVIIDVK